MFALFVLLPLVTHIACKITLLCYAWFPQCRFSLRTSHIPRAFPPSRFLAAPFFLATLFFLATPLYLATLFFLAMPVLGGAFALGDASVLGDAFLLGDASVLGDAFFLATPIAASIREKIKAEKPRQSFF